MKKILLGVTLALSTLSAFAANIVTDSRGNPVVSSGKPVAFDGSGKQSSAGD